MITLKSFDLKIQGSQASGYAVEAIGPAGERASAPFDWASVADLADSLEAIQAGMAGRPVLEQVGTALFQALFPMDVMMVYVSVKAQLEEGEGLRLRLHLPPELARLPWELLYYPPFYLATDPRSPVVRFLDLPDTPRPLATQAPMRLLHLVAGPLDAPSLAADREAELLRAALADLTDRGAAEIMPARPGTQAALRDGLRRGAHILHFSGHGGFGREQGYLLFEDEERQGQPVDGDTLAHLLRGSQVRLAVLNACESALASVGDAFGSVAAALVRAGLPAVIAHQYTLPDSSAIPFAADLYHALASGFPVDAAVSEGRKAILSALGETWREHVDWATPVLFLRAPDGRLFDLEGKGAGAAAQPSVPIVHHQTFFIDDQVTIGTVSGGVVHIGSGDAPAGGQPTAPPLPTDRVPGLLEQLGRTVRDYAPQARLAEALEEVAALSDAAAEQPPDLARMESILHWFEAELPALSGAILSAILSLEPRAKQAGDETWGEFRRRFGQF